MGRRSRTKLMGQLSRGRDEGANVLEASLMECVLGRKAELKGQRSETSLMERDEEGGRGSADGARPA